MICRVHRVIVIIEIIINNILNPLNIKALKNRIIMYTPAVTKELNKYETYGNGVLSGLRTCRVTQSDGREFLET
jgi:hypothetical protein